MPKMNLSQEFERALAIARITMQFGQVRRVTMHENGEHESDTTHTVMLTLLGIEMAPLAGCDPGRALAAMDLAAADVHEKHATQGAQLAAQYPEMVEVRRLFAAACELVERAIRGGEMTVAVALPDDDMPDDDEPPDCATCRGTGDSSDDDFPEECRDCGGTGVARAY